MDGWMDGWTGGHKTDGWVYRYKEKAIDRQTDIQTDKKIDRQTE